MRMANRTRKGRRTFGATRRLPSGQWQSSYLAPDGTRRVAPQTVPEAADANAWLRRRRALNQCRKLAAARTGP